MHVIGSILIKNLLRFVAEGLINDKKALVQVMAWHPLCAKPLTKPVMTQFTNTYLHHQASKS